MAKTDTGRYYQAAERAGRFEVNPRMQGASSNGSSIATHDAISVYATLGVHEFFETALAGANNDLSWIARAPGASALSVVYVDPGGVSSTLSVSYAANLVTVNLGRAASAINTTANQIIAAVRASSSVSAQVAVANKSPDDGTGLVIALGSSALNANAGSLTLDVKMQYSVDNSNWADKPGAFAQQATVGSAPGLFAPLGPYSRWVFTTGGATPLFAISILNARSRWSR